VNRMLIALLLLTACGDDDRSPLPDAGDPQDAFVPVDVGQDAGPPPLGCAEITVGETFLVAPGLTTTIHPSVVFTGDALWLTVTALEEGTSVFDIFLVKMGCDGRQEEPVLVSTTEMANDIDADLALTDVTIDGLQTAILADRATVEMTNGRVARSREDAGVYLDEPRTSEDPSILTEAEHHAYVDRAPRDDDRLLSGAPQPDGLGEANSLWVHQRQRAAHFVLAHAGHVHPSWEVARHHRRKGQGDLTFADPYGRFRGLLRAGGRLQRQLPHRRRAITQDDLRSVREEREVVCALGAAHIGVEQGLERSILQELRDSEGERLGRPPARHPNLDAVPKDGARPGRDGEIAEDLERRLGRFQALGPRFDRERAHLNRVDGEGGRAFACRDDDVELRRGVRAVLARRERGGRAGELHGEVAIRFDDVAVRVEKVDPKWGARIQGGGAER